MTTQFNYLNDFVAQTAKFLEPVIEFNEITARTVTELSSQQLGLLGETMDFGTGRLQAATQAEGIGDFADDQGRLATDFGTKLKDHAETAIKTVADAQKAYGQLFASVFQAQGDLVAQASEATKQATKKASKKAA